MPPKKTSTKAASTKAASTKAASTKQSPINKLWDEWKKKAQELEKAQELVTTLNKELKSITVKIQLETTEYTDLDIVVLESSDDEEQPVSQLEVTNDIINSSNDESETSDSSSESSSDSETELDSFSDDSDESDSD
jgi:predicted transcriptional regulator